MVGPRMLGLGYMLRVTTLLLRTLLLLWLKWVTLAHLLVLMVRLGSIVDLLINKFFFFNGEKIFGVHI